MPARMISTAAIADELYNIIEYNIQEMSFIWFRIGTEGSTTTGFGGVFWAKAMPENRLKTVRAAKAEKRR